MNAIERYLSEAGGNKTLAAANLAMGLMRGDPTQFLQGYSLGSALMAVIAHYNLTGREVALVADRIAGEITTHHSATRRPLVIVAVGGGLIQWTVSKCGLGTPRLYELDFDREGAEDDELTNLAEQIEEASKALASYGDDEDAVTIGNLDDAAKDYRQHVADGESMSRYR